MDMYLESSFSVHQSYRGLQNWAEPVRGEHPLIVAERKNWKQVTLTPQLRIQTIANEPTYP